MTAAVYAVVKAFQSADWSTRALSSEIERDFSSTSRIVRQLLDHKLIRIKTRILSDSKGRPTAVYAWVRVRVS